LLSRRHAERNAFGEPFRETTGNIENIGPECNFRLGSSARRSILWTLEIDGVQKFERNLGTK
jgi:hypothetical protein